ncbi:MAG: hypothetical protein HC769_08305 [Cyanobacteria bacterium CRU_2_1]|nr:hypothetical protein [Cyanobacteria bacterium RU_5_0]NJR58849.1 hypothetical protein [Cyanobacteria bacterium CRU_2_1]
MLKIGSNSFSFLGIVLVVAGLLLACVPMVRSHLFKRQDLVLIAVFLICGITLLFGKRSWNDGFQQFSLLLLSIPAIFYTVESVRLRGSRDRAQ